MFNTTTLVGITNEKGMILGPSDTDVIGPNGGVVVVADNKSMIEADIAKRKRSNENENIPLPGSQHLTMLRCPLRMPAPRKIVMLGWNEESSSVLKDMLVLAPPGSSITVITDHEFDKSVLKGNANCYGETRGHGRPEEGDVGTKSCARSGSGFDHAPNR